MKPSETPSYALCRRAASSKHPESSPPFLEVFGGPVGELSNLPFPVPRVRTPNVPQPYCPSWEMWGWPGSGLARGCHHPLPKQHIACPPQNVWGWESLGCEEAQGQGAGVCSAVEGIVSVVFGALPCVVTGGDLLCQQSSPAPKIYCLVTIDALRHGDGSLVMGVRFASLLLPQLPEQELLSSALVCAGFPKGGCQVQQPGCSSEQLVQQGKWSS